MQEDLSDKNRIQIFSRIEQEISAYKKPVIVGINGVDGSGKTEFALGFENYLKSRGLHTLLIHGDNFANPSAVNLDDNSPYTYLDGNYNYEKLYSLLSRVRMEPQNIELDLFVVNENEFTMRKVKKMFSVDNETIIIVEGVLLYRPPIDSLFDYKVFLDIDFEEVLRRVAVRDIPKYGESFIQRYHSRYIPAEKMYIDKFNPKANCNLVVDNNDYNKPIVANAK